MRKKTKAPAEEENTFWVLTCLAKGKAKRPCAFCRTLKLKGCPGANKPHVLQSGKAVQLRLVKASC